MPAEPVRRADTFSVAMSQSLVSMRGTPETQAKKLIRLAGRNPIPGGFMICMVMSGNGFRTGGMIAIMDLLLTTERWKMETVPILSLVEEAGTAIPISAAQLPASAASLRVGSQTLGFGL